MGYYRIDYGNFYFEDCECESIYYQGTVSNAENIGRACAWQYTHDNAADAERYFESQEERDNYPNMSWYSITELSYDEYEEGV